ncbi:MAG: hypothetical protein KC466_01505 [Myxococcales bacterium]|nr:hypothetical protein [Myxococcales bacterium]
MRSTIQWGIVVGAGIFVATAAGAPASADEVEALTASHGAKRTLRRDVGLAQFEGVSIPAILGQPIDAISVLAFRDGKLDPIPFQIDERDAEGQWILPNGPEANESDDGRRLDANDVVVFEARAPGDRIVGAVADYLDVKPLAAQEVELYLPKDGTSAWVYVAAFEGAAPKSPVDYVSYDPVTQTVVGREYQLRFDPKIPPSWEMLKFRTEDGKGWTDNLIDRVKIRIGASLFWGLADAERTEEDVNLKVLAYKDGAVRVIRRQATSLDVALGLKSPETIANLVFMPDGLDIPIEVRLAFDPGGFFRNISWYQGTDFRDLRSAEVIVPIAPTPLKIDGRMDEVERSVSDRDCPWVVLRRGSQALVFWMTIGGKTPLKTRFQWIDDADGDRPKEYVRGQLPRVGYSIVGWEEVKAGTYFITMRTRNIPNYTPGMERAYLASEDDPVLVARPR